MRGRPAGVRRGDLRPGDRLNLIETLRAATPWQRVRRAERERGQAATPPVVQVGVAKGKKAATKVAVPRVEIRQDDFRITRFKHRSETTTIFVVDASGSSALHRLAEAKGAVELLLADCYVRRDRVALVAFRGQFAEVLLPPTRSLVRAKRSLASLPGGGGTPLASGIDLGMMLADSVKRRGGTPILIIMTDGRANVARDGTGGRARANEDALSAARLVRSVEITSLVIDTSPLPHPQGPDLADEMDARYLPLPHADATSWRLPSAQRMSPGTPLMNPEGTQRGIVELHSTLRQRGRSTASLTTNRPVGGSALPAHMMAERRAGTSKVATGPTARPAALSRSAACAGTSSNWARGRYSSWSTARVRRPTPGAPWPRCSQIASPSSRPTSPATALPERRGHACRLPGMAAASRPASHLRLTPDLALGTRRVRQSSTG